ncbi:YlxR family protein [Leptothoe sp. EHU-05/26/07-4]
MRPNYRRCVSCRKAAHRDQFLRVVRTYPTGTIQLNYGMGRSAYLCPQIDCLNSAHKKNRLGRSLKAPVPEEIYQHLHQLIKQNLASPR